MIDAAVQKQGYTSNDFFMMSFTGTQDFAGSGFTSLINELLKKSSGNFIAGTNSKIEVFNGLPHGFGLGKGTVAEGWINNAIDFWKSQM